MIIIANPYAFFTDTDGEPLNNGSIYFGTANLDPRTNPITIYSDAALTVPVAQPVRTIDGYLVYQGSPIRVQSAATDYSIRIEDSRGGFVYQSLSNPGITPAEISWLETGTGAVTRTLDAKIREEAISVIDFVLEALRAGIVANTGTTELVTYFDAASTACVAQNRPLYVPRGTYTMKTWSPPAGLVVLTAGPETVFKQLDTVSVGAQRFIRVLADGVQLWPGGSATIDGSMTAGGINATSFNSGVQVYAGAAVTIKSFVCGDIFGLNIGGDVLETGAAATGTITKCKIGTIYGDNVYRNCLTVTAGLHGSVDAVIQTGGCGLLTVDFEPDPSSGAGPIAWTIGTVRGHRVGIAGDPAVVMGNISIGHLDLDYSRPASSPIFNYGGVSLALTPTLFENCLRYRNVKSVHIDSAVIVGFPRCAIEDIGSGGGDTFCDVFKIGELEIRNCGATPNYQVVTQKTYLFEVGFLKTTVKTAAAIGSIIGGNASNHIRVNGGNVNGSCIGQAAGSVDIRNTVIDGDAQNVLNNIVGQLTVDGLTVTDTNNLFAGCTLSPMVRNSTLTATNIISGATPNARLFNTTANSVLYPDNWFVTQAAVASAATITLPKYGNVIPISGTTNITAITADAGHKGRTVTLVFAGALTFTDGGSLLLAGNLVTTADDTITIATTDGTTWYEVCRSVN